VNLLRFTLHASRFTLSVSRFTALVPLLMSIAPAAPRDLPANPSPHERVLYAVALVESGFNHRAVGRLGERGAWQFTRETWGETSQQLRRLHIRTHPFRFAHDPVVGALYARTRMDFVRRMLATALDRQPTAQEMYCAWNLGLGGFLARDYRVALAPQATRDAALRVANLCLAHPHTQSHD
jgi:hypothetical protein